MKKLLLLVFTLHLNFITLQAQSFEAVSFPDITDTPSASRSANFIDVNNDGWDDIFITNGPFSGADNMLYLNNQDGTFTTITNDPIVSDNDRSDGASFADVDNDGDLDAVVVTFGANGVGHINYFYRNEGNGTFTHENLNAIGDVLTYSEMASWMDVNNDAHLDLYVTNSVGNLKNLYYENLQNGDFEENNSLTITNENLPSRSINWVDYDNDGDGDLFVSNEEGTQNSLYRNDGNSNFTQITNSGLTSDQESTTGSSWADIDNDGDFDVFIANIGSNGERNQLFINNQGVFTEDTNSVIQQDQTNSFGSTFGDVDNDGDLDLLVCNAYLPGQDTNFLYINDGSGNFTKDTSSALAQHEGWTFGAAFGDYNNDGWLDVILANNENDNQANAVYKNTGSGNNWVKLQCQGTASNASAIGARVQIKATIDGSPVWQTRYIEAASGYCSQNSLTVHFGLKDASSIETLRVRWPNGTTEEYNSIALNNTTTIIEGQGILQTPDQTSQNFTLWPNPVENELHISASSLQQFSSVTLSIYSITGSLVLEKELEVTSSNTLSTSIKQLSSGDYLFKLTHNKKQLHQGKFLKN